MKTCFGMTKIFFLNLDAKQVSFIEKNHEQQEKSA